MNVICMKWGMLYGPEYVNRLHASVQRWLPDASRFVCFTDDAKGLKPGIETHPLPDTGAPATADTRWRKLALFQPGLADLSGPCLFLDLDLVIVGDLSPLATLDGRFLAIRDASLFRPNRSRQLFRPQREAFYQRVANTSVFRFEAGAHPDLLSRYVEQHSSVVATYRNEQEYLSDHLHAQGALAFWPESWCVSFKNACVPPLGKNLFTDPQCPPDARIVVFAGRPKMSDVVEGRGSRWYRRIGPAPWLRQAWINDTP